MEFIGRDDRTATAEVVITTVSTLVTLLNERGGDWRGGFAAQLAVLLDAIAESDVA